MKKVNYLRELFWAIKTKKLKDFFDSHYDAVNDISLILNQPKNASIHASGILITPIEKPIYDWFPCKMMDGVLISEWEGAQLDDSGFLKVDILGLNQLDKLNHMVDLIEINTKTKIDLQAIYLNVFNVYDLFSKGCIEDVFHFGTDVLSAYCREVKPTSILDLAAINALYRPGPMDSGAHNDYVKLRFGKKEPEYDWQCEELLKSTYGLILYQEQAIKMVQVLAGFTLSEADNVRKNIGKKLMDKMKLDKDKFLAGCVERGCEVYEANKIWNKIEVFAGYSFNLSHAVAYSLIGYQTQWIKYHYPLEFWTISLQYAGDDEVPKRVSEIHKFNGINLFGPDINNSKDTFYTNWETNSIYWSMGRISHLGNVALEAIIKEREKNGKFFSLEEFVKRTKSQAVNSRVVKHLILSGAFDALYSVEKPIQRRKIMEEFCKLYFSDFLAEIDSEEGYSDFFWYRLQRDLCGFGQFDYIELVDDFIFARRQFILPEQIQLTENLEYEGVITGILISFVKRQTKKGEMAKLILDHNNDLIDVVLWNDSWVQFRKDIEGAEGKGIILNGRVLYDGYNKKNCIYSFEKTIVQIF